MPENVQNLSVFKFFLRRVEIPHYTTERWVKAFNDGRQSATDMQRPGQPSINEEAVQTMLHQADSKFSTMDAKVSQKWQVNHP